MAGRLVRHRRSLPTKCQKEVLPQKGWGGEEARGERGGTPARRGAAGAGTAAGAAGMGVGGGAGSTGAGAGSRLGGWPGVTCAISRVLAAKAITGISKRVVFIVSSAVF